MKRILFFIVVAILMTGCNNTMTTEAEVKSSTFEEQMQDNTKDLPVYKMIQTENIHILLKWNTRTGEVWMTQYALKDTDALEHKIEPCFFIDSNNSWNGRFELYSTKNMFNYIMVDTYYGNTYQVQWNTDNEYCFITPINDSNYSYSKPKIEY